LTDFTGPDERGGHHWVSEHPGDCHLRQGLTALLSQVV